MSMNLRRVKKIRELYEMSIKECDDKIPEITKEKIPWRLGLEPEA